MIKGPPPPPFPQKVKFNQNRPINEEIDVFEGRGKGAPYHKILSQLLLVIQQTFGLSNHFVKIIRASLLLILKKFLQVKLTRTI